MATTFKLHSYVSTYYWIEMTSKWCITETDTEACKSMTTPAEAGRIWRFVEDAPIPLIQEQFISTGYRGQAPLSRVLGVAPETTLMKEALRIQRERNIIERRAAILGTGLDSFQEWKLWRRRESVGGGATFNDVIIAATPFAFYSKFCSLPYNERGGYSEYVHPRTPAKICMKLQCPSSKYGYDSWDWIVSHYQKVMIEVLISQYGCAAHEPNLENEIQRMDIFAREDGGGGGGLKITWLKTRKLYLRNFHTCGLEFMNDVLSQLKESYKRLRPLCDSSIYQAGTSWADLLMSQPSLNSYKPVGEFCLNPISNKTQCSETDFLSTLILPPNGSTMTLIHRESQAIQALQRHVTKICMEFNTRPTKRRRARHSSYGQQLIRQTISINRCQSSLGLGVVGENSCTAIALAACYEVIHSVCEAPSWKHRESLKISMHRWLDDGVKLQNEWLQHQPDPRKRDQLSSPTSLINLFGKKLRLSVDILYTEADEIHRELCGGSTAPDNTRRKRKRKLRQQLTQSCNIFDEWGSETHDDTHHCLSNPESMNDSGVSLEKCLIKLRHADAGIFVGDNRRSVAVGALYDNIWWLFDSHGRDATTGQMIGNNSVLILYYRMDAFIHHIKNIFPEIQHYEFHLLAKLFDL